MACRRNRTAGVEGSNRRNPASSRPTRKRNCRGGVEQLLRDSWWPVSVLLTILLFVLLFSSAEASPQTDVCRSQFSNGRTPTVKVLRQILDSHAAWLSKTDYGTRVESIPFLVEIRVATPRCSRCLLLLLLH